MVREISIYFSEREKMQIILIGINVLFTCTLNSTLCEVQHVTSQKKHQISRGVIHFPATFQCSIIGLQQTLDASKTFLLKSATIV